MRAKRHIRRYTVETARGFVSARITLKGATSDREVVLAAVRPPFCTVEGDQRAHSDFGEHTVEKRELQSSETQFRTGLILPDATEVTWAYRVSASVPLHAGEFGRWPDAIAIRENLGQHEFARRYDCQIDSDVLQIDWEFDQPVPGIEAFVLVEDYDIETQNWRRDPVAEGGKGCRLRQKVVDCRWALVISNPTVGRRYAIGFRFPPRARGEEERALALGERLAVQCRSESSGEQSALVRPLSDRLVSEIESKLGARLDPSTACVGLLWQQSRYKLLTAFGKFPNEQWGVRFGFGDGVAGHAFRFASSATYSAREGASSLLYARRPSSKPPFEWVICVPLRLEIDGPLVGVVSIAGSNARSPAELQLSALAQSAAANSATAQSELDDLHFLLNLAFWEVVLEKASEVGLAGAELEWVRRTVTALTDKVSPGEPNATTAENISVVRGLRAWGRRRWRTLSWVGTACVALLTPVLGWDVVQETTVGWFRGSSAAKGVELNADRRHAAASSPPPALPGGGSTPSEVRPTPQLPGVRLPEFADGLATLEITTVDSSLEAKEVMRKLRAKLIGTKWSANLVSRTAASDGRVRHVVLVDSVDPRAGARFCDWLDAQGWHKPTYGCSIR